jgi:hypothetical protein
MSRFLSTELARLLHTALKGYSVETCDPTWSIPVYWVSDTGALTHGQERWKLFILQTRVS